MMVDAAVESRKVTPIPIPEFGTVELEAGLLMREGVLDLFPGLEEKGFITTRLTTRAVKLQAQGFVGLIPLNDRVTLDVRPRVPIGNLHRVMEISRVQPEPLVAAIRRYERSGEMYPSLIRLYAEALTSALVEIRTSGLLKEYVRHEQLTSHPRGRLLVSRTMQRAAARGTTHRAVASWFQRTADIPVNRCLLAAVWRLHQYTSTLSREDLQGRERRDIARLLNTCLNQLQGVARDQRGEFMRDPTVLGRQPLPTLRGYYRTALDLALAILGGQGVALEYSEGGIQLPSLVVKLSDVFEAYVRNTLVATAAREEWPAQVLDGNLQPPRGARKSSLLDSGMAIQAKPDAVLRIGAAADSSTPVVVEVKYRPAKLPPDRADLEQLITYGASYRAEDLVLVVPRASSRVTAGMHEVGRLAGMRIWVLVVDLGADDLSQEEHRFAQDVGNLLAG